MEGSDSYICGVEDGIVKRQRLYSAAFKMLHIWKIIEYPDVSASAQFELVPERPCTV